MLSSLKLYNVFSIRYVLILMSNRAVVETRFPQSQSTQVAFLRHKLRLELE